MYEEMSTVVFLLKLLNDFHFSKDAPEKKKKA